jgi:hypothetical protein
MALANKQNCAVLNISSLPKSRLTFPRLGNSDFQSSFSYEKLLANQNQLVNLHKVGMALAAEKNLGYLVPSGRYWETIKNFDPVKLRMIDDIWIDSFKQIEFS